jgi:vacuolar-type H+-ATPase subunit F/Vma7
MTVMARVAVIGEATMVAGYGLAGAMVYPADTRAAAIAAWRLLPPQVTVVLLTARAAGWLDQLPRPGDRLLVVMPS